VGRHDAIAPELEQWLAQQRVFFVATAPLAADGHVNCSPRGLDCFRVLGDGLVRYRRDKNASSIDGLPAIDP
jgi:hypothetical protein